MCAYLSHSGSPTIEKASHTFAGAPFNVFNVAFDAILELLLTSMVAARPIQTFSLAHKLKSRVQPLPYPKDDEAWSAMPLS